VTDKSYLSRALEVSIHLSLIILLVGGKDGSRSRQT